MASLDNDARKDYIKKHLSIPDYFDLVILPEKSDYYAGQHVDLHAYPKCCCPLHDESTPSFNYSEEYQSFKCYGCDSSGDVISLHREYMKNEHDQYVSWSSALTYLYKLAKTRQGKLTQDAIFKQKKEVTNTSTDITLFKVYLTRWINLIRSRKDITVEDKAEIIATFETVRSGILGDDLKASDGIAQIKELLKAKKIYV